MKNLAHGGNIGANVILLVMCMQCKVRLYLHIGTCGIGEVHSAEFHAALPLLTISAV